MRETRFASLIFHAEDRTLTGPEKKTALRPKVAALLQLLIDRYPAVVGKEECLARLWPDTHVEPRALAQVVVELRGSLNGVGGKREWIENIPKHGYRFVEKPQEGQGLFETPRPNGKQFVLRGAKSSRPRFLSGLALAVFLFAGFIAFQGFKASDKPVDPIRLAVLPLQAEPGLEAGWLKYAYPELLTEALDKTGLVETVGVDEVYRAIQHAPNDDAGDRRRAMVETALGVNAVVQVELKAVDQGMAFKVITTVADKASGFSFETREPAATVNTVAARVLDSLDLGRPPRDFADDPFLNKAFASGYAHYLKGEYSQAQPYFAICLEHSPDFGRHAYYLTYAHIHLREYDKAGALLDHPECPADAEWDYLRAERHYAKRHFEPAAETLRAILSRPDSPRRVVAKAHLILGLIMTRTDRAHLGQEHFDKAIAQFKAMGHLNGQINATRARLNAKQHVGLAIDHREWHELIQLSQLLQNRALEAQALAGLGENHYGKQEWRQAYEVFERSLELRRALDDALGIGVCLSGMGCASMFLGEFERAESQLTAALAINIDQDDGYNQINQRLNLGNLFLAQAKLDLAEAHYQGAAALSREQADAHGEALALQGLAETALHRGAYDRAEAYLDRGEALGVSYAPLRAGFKCYRAALAYQRKDAHSALALMLEAKSLRSARDWGDNARQYHRIYQAAAQTGAFAPLPYERDPRQGPERP